MLCFHTVKLKKIGDKTYPFLGAEQLFDGDKVEVKFDDGHCKNGKVFIQEFCCDGVMKPFITISYHGKKPWIYLVGLKAKRA